MISARSRPDLAQVRSATSTTAQISVCRLDIDIKKNLPNVLLHERLPNEEVR